MKKHIKDLEDFFEEHKNILLVLSIFILITFTVYSTNSSLKEVVSILSALIAYILMIIIIYSPSKNEDSFLLSGFKALLSFFVSAFCVWVILNLLLEGKNQGIMILMWLLFMIMPGIKIFIKKGKKNSNKKPLYIFLTIKEFMKGINSFFLGMIFMFFLVLLITLFKINFWFCIVGILFLGISFYFLAINFKSQNQDIFLKILGFFLTIIITLGVTNQIVQPLFIPRISEIEINPLFIQSEKHEGNDAEYYGVYEVIYNVDVPLLIRNSVFELDLLGKRDEQRRFFNTDPPELLTYKVPGGHYHTINLNSLKNPGIYLNVEDDLQGKLEILIEPNGFEVKNIEIKLPFREKLSLALTSLSLSDHDWYSEGIVAPFIFDTQPFTAPIKFFIGYGLRNPLGRPYKISFYKIKNMQNIPIKGFYLKVPDNPETFICEDGDILKNNMNGWVSFDLEPKETKTIYMMEQMPAEHEIKPYELKFSLINFNYDEACFGLMKSLEKI